MTTISSRSTSNRVTPLNLWTEKASEHLLVDTFTSDNEVQAWLSQATTLCSQFVNFVNPSVTATNLNEMLENRIQDLVAPQLSVFVGFYKLHP